MHACVYAYLLAIYPAKQILSVYISLCIHLAVPFPSEIFVQSLNSHQHATCKDRAAYLITASVCYGQLPVHACKMGTWIHVHTFTQHCATLLQQKYVCVRACIHVQSMYVCMCMYACMHACRHACMQACIYLRTRVHMYVCMYVMHSCMYVRS